MNLKKAIRNNIAGKGGSYVVEAAMTLPVLIVCVCALVLVIRIISVCESVCYTTSEEILKIDQNSYKINNTISLCKGLEESLLEENISELTITKFKYLYSDSNMTDLIAFDAKVTFNVVNALGINGKITFEERLLSRGFTGELQYAEALEEADFVSGEGSHQVVVFPKYGVRYHRTSCKYVKQNDTEDACKIIMEKEDAIRKGYTPCKVCEGAANV